MKYAYFSVGMISLGLIGIVFIVMFQSLTTNNETEYYVLKEAMEAAMLESVDFECYKETNKTGCGEVIKISEQKFVENFTRRFVSNMSGDVNSYKLEFYDIIESPPKVSVIVKGKTKSYSILAYEKDDGTKSEGKFEIVNKLSAILEYEPVKKIVENSEEGSKTRKIIHNDEGEKIKFEEIEIIITSETTNEYDEENDYDPNASPDDGGMDADTDAIDSEEIKNQDKADSEIDEPITEEEAKDVEDLLAEKNEGETAGSNVENEDENESDVEENNQEEKKEE